MKLYNFNTAYTVANNLYGVDPTYDEFEEIGMIAWERIGNKYSYLDFYVTDTKNKIIELPCHVESIESVHLSFTDYQMTSNKSIYNSVNNLITENYIESWKKLNSPFYKKGKLIKYNQVGNALQFSRDYSNVTVVYKRLTVDEEGLPMLNQKEVDAIAIFVAYSHLFKKGLMTSNPSFINMAQSLKVDWLRKCNAARIPIKFTQNDMDMILDAKVRWDRKTFGKSYKPIL